MGIPSDEALLNSAMKHLRERGDQAATALLASCRVRVECDDVIQESQGSALQVVQIELIAPDAVQATLNDRNTPTTRAIYAAIRQVLPPEIWIERIFCRPVGEIEPVVCSMQPPSPPSLISSEQTTVSNQGTNQMALRMWNGLRFYTESEVRIAEALERAGVLFVPNCMVRLGPEGQRENREPDFLICSNGAWGILEVDGGPYHPPTRTAIEHERDRLFKAHGIMLVEHFDSQRCYADPDGVVQEFLSILTRTPVPFRAHH